MSTPSDDDTGTWLVLVNDQGQHSLWPALRPVPAGWNEVGPEGDQATCLEWIEQHWADIRPTNLN